MAGTARDPAALLPLGRRATLLRNADRALYVAKNNGRNRTETFTREMVPNDPIIEPILSEPAPILGSSDGDNGNASRPPAPREPARTQGVNDVEPPSS